MSIVKKWASSVVSLLAGVLALVLSACSGISFNATIAKKSVWKDSTKAYEIITDSDLMDQAKLFQLEDKFSTLKILSIILMIVAILLIIWAIVLMLKNLKIINVSDKVSRSINILFSVALIVSVILVIIATKSYGDALADKLAITQFIGATISVSIGVYQWTMLAVSAITLFVLCVVKSAQKSKRSKKSK